MTLFRTVPVAETVYRDDRLPPWATAYPVDSITLGWEERMKVRARRRTDGSVEFATALQRGTVLREGDALLLHSLPLTIVVRELAEPVFILSPRSSREWALWSYHIGNAHQPLMVADDALVCPEVPGVEHMLAYHAIPFARELRPFTPEAQAPSHHGGA